jgi:hypothetical protein
MPPDASLLVTAHLVSALFLVGMIWTVQIVHYPLMARVGPEAFPSYAAAHASRMTALVALPWALQGLTTLGLLLSSPPGVRRDLVWAEAVSAAIPVVVTVVASVPAHVRLGEAFDPAVHRRLVATNWIRTASWTVHGAFAVAIAITAG